jgi:hypothetical protein
MERDDLWEKFRETGLANGQTLTGLHPTIASLATWEQARSPVRSPSERQAHESAGIERTVIVKDKVFVAWMQELTGLYQNVAALPRSRPRSPKWGRGEGRRLSIELYLAGGVGEKRASRKAGSHRIIRSGSRSSNSGRRKGVAR